MVTQFQGAFNDNALKFLVIYLIVARDFPSGIRDQLVLLVGALFALPYILFSLAGGYLADRYSKRSVTIGTKIFEIGVMIFALASLAAGNVVMECAAVFLISTQGALFGPSKYGLLQSDERGRVQGFSQKPKLGDYVNGGFMVMSPGVFDYVDDGMIEDALIRMAADHQLSVYRHGGFWKAMDTYQEMEELNRLWESERPWAMWEKHTS